MSSKIFITNIKEIPKSDSIKLHCWKMLAQTEFNMWAFREKRFIYNLCFSFFSVCLRSNKAGCFWKYFTEPALIRRVIMRYAGGMFQRNLSPRSSSLPSVCLNCAKYMHSWMFGGYSDFWTCAFKLVLKPFPWYLTRLTKRLSATKMAAKAAQKPSRAWKRTHRSWGHSWDLK